MGKFKHYILLHAIIFMWGFTGILGKLIHLDPLPIVWYRVLIAFLALFLFLAVMKKDMKIGNRKNFLLIFLTGIIVALHWYTFYMAIQLSTASLGILCLSTTTLHVAWLEPLIMNRSFSWLELGLGVLVMFGIYYVSGEFNSSEYLALGYGLSSAFLAALFAVINARLVLTTSASKITLYEMLAATLFLSVVMVFQNDFTLAALSLTLSDFLWLLFLGVLCTSFAFLATIDVVKKLGAFTVSLSINLEPVYTILLAIVILNEDDMLNFKFYLGSGLIVFVVALNGLLKGGVKNRS